MGLLEYRFTKESENVILSNFCNSDNFYINEKKEFMNRTLVCNESSAFMFDGYATWFEGRPIAFQQAKDITLTFVIAPLSYETVVSGLISQYSDIEKKGFYIGITKLGRVIVGFGDGFSHVEYETIDRHLDKYQWNVVTVIIDCTSGWSTIIVNGIVSNRKQFARQRRVLNPDLPCYVGKFVDEKKFNKNAKQGTYHGYMYTLLIETKAKVMEDVIQQHKQMSICNQFGTIQTILDRAAYQMDCNRPRYHLIAPGKWMNEPHAPMYYNGYYHIFYQANQHAPLFDNLQWGHMISTDMVHWKDLKLALQTQYNGLDPDGCWSGSSCVDKEGIPTIFYTAGNNRAVPNQGIAIAEAVIDRESKLEDWKKHDQLVVKQCVQDGWLGEFRDPFVWLEGNTYYMLVGTGDSNNGGGNAILYTSNDKKEWKKENFIVEYSYENNPEVGHVWELPVLLPVRDDAGQIAFHVLLLCACQIENNIVHTYYWQGDWDAANRKFIKHHEKAFLIDLGQGVFTGPSGFVTPDRRSVVFSIAQGKRNSQDEFQSGWAHNGGLPIELYAKAGKLGIRPIREVYELRNNLLLDEHNITIEQLNKRLVQITISQLYIKVIHSGNSLGISIDLQNRKEEVFYNRKEKHFGVQTCKRGKEKILASVQRDDTDKVDVGQEPIVMEYFLDNSMIEVYLNNLKTISHRNYTENNNRLIQVTSNDDAVINHIQVWSMRDAYCI